MQTDRVAVVGAGVAGLVAAAELSSCGVDVVVVERASGPGGKMREVPVGDARIDAGPTVLTMRWVFDEIFDAAGASFDGAVALRPAEILARHAWAGAGRLDLFGDVARTADAIGDLAGSAEARGYRRFCESARSIYETLEGPFLRASRPGLLGLVRGVGPRRLGELRRLRPFSTLWNALGEYFQDPRLRQLFGRYATYVGSSPFLAPATLMLVAHVERSGVWLVEGGMHRVAVALARLAAGRGAKLRYDAPVAAVTVSEGRANGLLLASGERIEADAVLFGADVAALAGGRLGPDVIRAAPAIPASERSLSALTWAMVARTSGFPMVRHGVFFSGDAAAEFEDLFVHARLPREPTVYVCAQDRDASDRTTPTGPERLFCLVNAPATGDTQTFRGSERERCERRAFELLARCGLEVERTPEATVVTMPDGFERLFPGTGGALYGRSTHGWRASFLRPGPRSALPGLYLAGGGTHPGAGVPMAGLSGRMAARTMMTDLASMRRSRPAATSGGTWTP